MDEIRARFPQVGFLDPNQIICRGEKCSPTLGDILLYRDSMHMNDIGSRSLGESLLHAGIKLATQG